MKTHLKLLMSGAAISCLMLPAPAVFAQATDTSTNDYDEITVTARKREESLTEVPVSISVLSDTLIEDTGILTQQDLFDLVPGIQYDEQIDRNSASPSIRGVGTDEIATNRTKVTQFIDGMPVLGSQGNIQFGSVQQVEVFRGPQSAAFGRSTFGGAINYVTKDPGDEFEAEATLDVNDYGTRRAGVSLGGPVPIAGLGDTLGYRIDVQIEDSTSPDEFIATDGSHWGERSSNAWSGKLVWEPTDALTAEFMYSHVDSEDEASVGYFIGEDAFNACFDGVTVDNMGQGAYADGQPDCDWSQGSQIVSQIDRVPAVQAAIDAGDYGVLTADQTADLLYLADAQSITPDQNGAFDERDRFALQVDYAFDNGSLMQFSAFTGTEEYIRIQDTNQDARALVLGLPNAMNGFYSITTGGPNATVGSFMADPSEIEETYAEVRYVSPGEDRLRYVLGASYYDYTFVTDLYFGGYTAVLDGTTDRYDALLGNFYNDGASLTDADGTVLTDGTGTALAYEYANAASGVINPSESLATPTQIFQEVATNTGIYGNVSYDFTDQITATLEARYQVDKVGGILSTNGVSGELTTEAFLPRLSVNYNLDNGSSYYAQYARGNNPAGVNVGFFDETLANTLDCAADDYVIAGDPTSGLNLAPGADIECGQNYVDYTSEQMAYFEEETIDNFEVGTKGRIFDGAITYAAAAFYMDWKNQGRTVNLDWTDQSQNIMSDYGGNRTLVNEGDIIMKGVEFEGTFNLTDDVSVRGQFSYLDAKYDSYCDLNLLGGGYTEEAALTLNVTDSGTGYSCVDVSGKQVVQQAPLTGSISPSYRTELDNGLRFSARADIRYEGAQFLDTINQWETNAVTTVNASTGLTGDRWGLTLYVNNLFDEDQPLRYGNNDDYTVDPTGNTNLYYITPRTQRTIGLRANVSY